MTWVRGPWWDSFWLLSGLPITVALVVFVPSVHIWQMAAAIMILETGHLVSPMIVAWTKPELRAIVSQEWIKHIVAPIAVMVGVLSFPVAWVMGLYWVWNIYHFGMQNFGVSSLYFRGGNPEGRVYRVIICLGLTAFGMGVLPFLIPDPRVSMFILGIFGFAHWITDIGLSSRVARWHWGFITAVLVIGVVWYFLRNGPLSVHVVPQILLIRAGIGMIHFIYSARIWKFSDPLVRAAIGRVFGIDNRLQLA